MDTFETQYWLTRLVFQKALALIYLVAFAIALNQARPLIGEHGLLPARLFIQRIHFWDSPSLFWFHSSDRALFLAALFGVLLSLFALSGFSESFGLFISMLTWASLWLVYLSFVNIGQTFYGFGWEMLLLETGFLSIFLGSSNMHPPVIIIWLLRWVLFRIMFGAGMIKLRGDSCWRDLTCMIYHYETQPSPNPLSWFFHHLPAWAHRIEVACTHVVEILVPFGFFAPAPYRWLAGLVTIAFQIMLILSGNLSWLNYMTIVLCIACFDDSFFKKILPWDLGPSTTLELLPWFHHWLITGIGVLVAFLSLKPARNLISSNQMMNASFDPLHLVNTYGAFGSITRTRYEIIIEGTNEVGLDAKWQEYQFKGKPGDVMRRPSIASPYHYKLDWQMWFAAMSNYYDHPWILNLVGKLLQNDEDILGLMAFNPFPTSPPHYIRAEIYEYHFTKNLNDKAWWERQRVGVYMPALSLDDERFRSTLARMGWLQ